MIELTGKQKRHLRGMGQKLRPLLAIGKAGLSDGFVATADELLRRQELIKLRLPAGSGGQRQQLAEQLAEAVGACCAGVVGRTALLYRPNPDLPDDDRIELPPANQAG